MSHPFAFLRGSAGSKLIPDFSPPIAGPDTENFTSIVFAKESTSFWSKPILIRVPPPAAPPRKELITVQPSASVSGPEDVAYRLRSEPSRR